MAAKSFNGSPGWPQWHEWTSRVLDVNQNCLFFSQLRKRPLSKTADVLIQTAARAIWTWACRGMRRHSKTDRVPTSRRDFIVAWRKVFPLLPLHHSRPHISHWCKHTYGERALCTCYIGVVFFKHKGADIMTDCANMNPWLPGPWFDD